MNPLTTVSICGYLSSKSVHKSSSKNVGETLDLFYLAKNNRPRSYPANVAHPHHPSGQRLRLNTPAEAYAYVAEVARSLRLELKGSLGFGVRQTFLLVPVPSSDVTENSVDTARWPARELAKALAVQGFGRVWKPVVNREATEPTHAKKDAAPAAPVPTLSKAEIIAHNYVRRRSPPPTADPILYVDDLLTWGDHLVALDHVLAPRIRRGAFAIAITCGQTIDCYEPRAKVITCDTSSSPWGRPVVADPT
ncbi:MAG: hypothetical protein WKG00_03455 [Polyangiaceae bacterium]